MFARYIYTLCMELLKKLLLIVLLIVDSDR